MPYPESLLPEAEVIDLSDEEDDDEDVPMVSSSICITKIKNLTFTMTSRIIFFSGR